MIYGTQSDVVDSQSALKKVQGKVLTNTKTFPAQEPVSPILVSAGSVWLDPLPTSGELVNQDTSLWTLFEIDINNLGAPRDYYEIDHPDFNIKQILVKCTANAGTEDYSFDIFDNDAVRCNQLITTAFGNHFQPRIWKWSGTELGSPVSPISGVYWQIDSGGYLYTADKADIDYSATGYYLIVYRYSGDTLVDGGVPGVSEQEFHTPTAEQTEFTLSNTPNADTVEMRVNGIKQRRLVDYTVSTDVVTWISTDFSLGTTDTVEFLYYLP